MNRNKPLFECQGCKEEMSWYEENLRMFRDAPICENCFSEMEIEEAYGMDFCDLEPFIPEYRKEIERLKADAELGRMVLRLRRGMVLLRQTDGLWVVSSAIDDIYECEDTPEEALRKAKGKQE